MTSILLIFNPRALPEFDGRTEHFEAWQENPFMGIEVAGPYDDEEIDSEITRRMGDNPDLKFLVA